MPLFDLPIDQLRVYQSSVATPPDFAEFWAATLAQSRVAAKPPIFEPVDYGLTLVDVFDVTFSGFGGQDVRAWLILPKHREGKLPCVVKYIGYGGGRSFPHEHLLWPAAGVAVFVMDTRGQGASWSRGDTDDANATGPAIPGVMTRGIRNKETYYYRRLYVDAVRAVDVVRAHEAIDAERIIVYGGSQGGGIALAVSGLVTGLAGVIADVPYLSDFPRAITTAIRDPYTEISRYLAVHREKIAETLATLAYFDTICFSRRASAPALVSVALMDTICPPSTVFGTFNAYAGTDKTIVEYGFNDHEGGGPFQEKTALDWLRRLLSSAA